mgnify:CR=1 FL=1
MNVTLPNGVIISDVPEGITQKELSERLILNNVITADELGFDPFEDERTASGQAFETAKGVGRGFANAFLSAGEGLAELADAGTNAIGLEDLIDSGDENDLVRAAREGRAAIDEAMGADIEYRDQWLTKFGEGVGSFASFFTPAGAVRLAGLAGKGIQASKAIKGVELGAIGSLAAGTGAGEQAQRLQAARDSGLDVSEGQEDAAIVGGGVIGMFELATPMRLLKRLRGLEAGDKLPSGIKERLGSALRSGSIEGIQEVAASLAQDALEKKVYNEALEYGGGNLMDDFTIGGSIGFGADLVLNAVAGRRNKSAFKEAQDAEGKKREDLADKVEARSQELAKDLAIDERAEMDQAQNLEAARLAGEQPVDPSQIAAPSGRAITSKIKTPARIVTVSSGSQSFQAEEKTRVRNKGKPTETITNYVEVPGGGEIITAVNGVPQETGLQIATAAEPTEGVQRRYPQQPMMAYAQTIRQAMGSNFPSADNTFRVNLPEGYEQKDRFGNPVVGEGQSTTELQGGVPVFTVVDSNGQQFGVPLDNANDAFGLASFLNDEIINDNVFSAGEAIIDTAPESYDADEKSTLQRYNFAANHPDANTYTSIAVNSAAETTQDRGFDEVADVRTLMENRVGPSKMTASQRINAKRLRKGLPITNTFTLQEIRTVLKEDQLYNLSDTRVNGLPETETYRPGLSAKGNPVVKSSAGETLQGRPLNQLEKDAILKKNPKAKIPKIVKFKTEADAGAYSNRLNNTTGKAAVEKGVMRNVNAKELKKLLSSKNITSKTDSLEVAYLASRILDKKTIKSIDDLSVAEARIFYQKLRSLPRFNSPTKLPVFKMPKYTGAQFKAASRLLQEVPNAGEVAIANATGITDPKVIKELKAELRRQKIRDRSTTEVEPVTPDYLKPKPVEPIAPGMNLVPVEQPPVADVERLRRSIRKVMKGFGLSDVATSLDFGLKTAVRTPDGELRYGIRGRRKDDPDDIVIGGAEGSGQFVRSNEADPEGRAEAYYSPDLNTIFLSIDTVMTDPSMTEAQIEGKLLELLDHEMIHAMRKMDLFTPKEYDLLARAASKKLHPTSVDENGNPRTFLAWARANYKDFTVPQIVEESVAELVRGTRADPKLLQGKPRSLVERLMRFLRNMVSSLRGDKLNSFGEVMGAIGSGQIGGRTRGEIRDLVQTDRELGRAERDARQGLSAPEGQSLPDFSRRAVGAPETDVRPEIADAYLKFQTGEFTREQYDSIVLGTLESYDFVPEPATEQEMLNALSSDKKDKVNVPVNEGANVGLRLDILAYTRNGVWVPTIHGNFGVNAKGSPIRTSHRATASITNADFTQTKQNAPQRVMEGQVPGTAGFIEKQRIAEEIAPQIEEIKRSDMDSKAKEKAVSKLTSRLAKFNKKPFAQIDGSFVSRTDEENTALAEQALNNPAWIQVGFDPRRHSYFYDRRTGEPVTVADEVIQVGPLVLAKNATKNVLPSGEQFETLFSRRGLDPQSPEQQSERLQRAREQGYDTSEVFYHGTQSNFEKFESSKAGRMAGGARVGFFFTNSPGLASGYAVSGAYSPSMIQKLKQAFGAITPQVMPVYLRKGKEKLDIRPFEDFIYTQEKHDARMKDPKSYPSFEERINEAKAEGYDSYTFGSPDELDSIVTIVFEPQNIRSVNAEFDPELVDSTNIMFSRVEAEMGVNVRTDGDVNYARLIVSGNKRYESRDKDSLRPYVGKRIGIIETGSGPAKLVGYATVGEPVEVGEAEFADSRDQHLVPEGSKFDIKPGQSKFLYEMLDPKQLDQPIDASSTKGIVARNISKLGDDNVRSLRGGDGRGRDQGRGRAPLDGAPIIAGATGPDPDINAAAESYAEKFGITLKRQQEYVTIDPEIAGRVALAYDDMAHNPEDPAVKEAYEDLARQTRDQYDELIDAGYKFTFFDSETDPYAGSPFNAIRDLRANKRMAVYGTYDGYGTEGLTAIPNKKDPLLQDTGIIWKDQLGKDHNVSVNDLFRAVHDAFGHGIEGAGFRARGEENAFQAHAKLFTGPALQALTAQTRGQNSWLNFGPYGERNRTANIEDTVFAENKTGLLPKWASMEGVDGEIMFSRRASEQGGIEGNVSTRYPTAARAKEDPIEDLLVNDYKTFLNDKAVFGKNMAIIKNAALYPILQKSPKLRSDEQKAEEFIDLVKNNLLDIHDRVPAETRKNSKLWYKGANALVRRFAERHDISMEQAAAVAAVLSPQKDWYQNASLAERTMDTYFNHAAQPFTREMKARAEEIYFHKDIKPPAQARNREMLKLIGSSSLDQVLNKFNDPAAGELAAAMWIRTFDQTYNDPSYRIVAPDGRLLDYAKNSNGSNSKVAWGSLNEIAKAVKALKDADISVISASLGSANKVRNFYNNIYDPDSDLGFVTIDTHAVAAGLLKPLGGSAFEVSHNFGTKGSSSSITGLNGIYSMYEEAYRRAAAERGVLPREMQSITWEAVRGLFRPEYKSQQSNVDVVDNIWKQYNSKKISLEQAREMVYEHANKIKPPDWERSGGVISEGDEATTYERKLPDGGVSRPRPDSATRRRRGSDAAREVQTEEVGLPFSLFDKYKKPEVIGQSEVDSVVEKNLEIAENRPAGTVPRLNPGADPYAQAVAANPDKGQQLSPSEEFLFSRANAPEIKPAAQSAIDNVVAELPLTTPGQTYLNVLDQGSISKKLTDYKQRYVNRYAQLENYQGLLGDLLADSSSMAAVLMADRSNAITGAALRYGVPVYTGGMTKVADFNHTNSRGETKKFRGLIDVMSILYTKDHGSLEQVAQAYSIARRSVILKQRGIEVPGTPQDHAANIATAESFLDADGNSIIKDWYNAWQDYNSYTVQFLKDTGVVDADTAELWLNQSDYVPFYRQVEGAETPNAPNIFGGLTGSADLKAIKGSEKQLNVPLLEAISMNLNAAISMGMKNVAQQRVVRDMKNIGLAREVRKGQSTAGEAVVTFKVKGDRRQFIVDDPLIYESLTVEPAGGVEREVAKYLGFPARALREMVTREPGFVIANMLRDSMSAFVTSGSNFIPIADTVVGFAEGMETLERSGVVGGYDYKNDPDNISEYAGKILQNRNKNVNQKGLLTKTFLGLWDGLGTVTTMSDAATRNAVYKDVLARTGNEAEAHFQAMEVLNFGRRGSSPVMRLLTATIPFLNARIQGLDVLIRAGAGKNTANKELSRGQAAASFIARGSLIAASTAIYYTMVSDDEQYKNQTEEIKDNYWIIPTPSGVPVRVPIPFEVGLLFKTLPERIIDAYNGETTARDLQQSAKRAIFGTLGVQPPQAITPILEAYMNYDMYSGRPVTPVFIDSTLDPQLQELASTSEVAKNMAKVLGISPIKLDHLMKGYGGTIGTAVLGFADQALRSNTLQGDNRSVLSGTDTSQKPILRRFFGSEFGGGAKEDFYEIWDYVKRTENTVKSLKEAGRMEELESFLVNRRQFMGVRERLQPTATALSKLRQQRRELLKADLTSDQKQEYMKLINTQEQYYLNVVPSLKRYVELPSIGEEIATRVSKLF